MRLLTPSCLKVVTCRFSRFSGATHWRMQNRSPRVSFQLNDGHISPLKAELHSKSNSRTATPVESPSPCRVSVGLVIIGNEILKGQVADTNSRFLCQHLTAVGADVRRISIIPDNITAISREISQLAPHVRWIIATGGIGPTHDDVTYESIANAFGLPLERSEVLVKMIRQHFKKGDDVDLTLPEAKLATIPQGSIVMLGDIRWGDPEQADPESEPLNLKPGMFPVVVTRNVVILPGIPVLLKRAFTGIRHLFESETGALAVRNIYVKVTELAFADHLNEVAETHKPKVLVGSYPDMTNNYYKAKLTFESVDDNAVDEAINQFVSLMPSDSIMFEEDFLSDTIGNAVESIYDFAHPSEALCTKLKRAVEITETAVKQHGHDNIAICFTGGKDCTVVLHILFAVLKRIYEDKPVHLLALQLSTFEPFSEVEQFIDETKRRYGFQFESYIGSGMKQSLNKFVEDYPHIKVVFMGTRRNDPSASRLHHTQKTDGGWPELIRVSPILDWSYSDVWNFLRHLHLPYCTLYDRGYTSLGNPSHTHPNRQLLFRCPTTSLLRYRPAFELDDETAERAGRDSSSQTPVPTN